MTRARSRYSRERVATRREVPESLASLRGGERLIEFRETSSAASLGRHRGRARPVSATRSTRPDPGRSRQGFGVETPARAVARCRGRRTAPFVLIVEDRLHGGWRSRSGGAARRRWRPGRAGTGQGRAGRAGRLARPGRAGRPRVGVGLAKRPEAAARPPWRGGRGCGGNRRPATTSPATSPLTSAVTRSRLGSFSVARAASVGMP